MSESNFNRRDFLKSACISVGALSLSGCVDTDKSKSGRARTIPLPLKMKIKTPK